MPLVNVSILKGGTEGPNGWGSTQDLGINQLKKINFCHGVAKKPV
jgi:hypothetical protein